MIRYPVLLSFFIFLCIACFASNGNLKFLYEKYTNTLGHDLTYHDDIEQHRQHFFEWIARHDLWDPYSRVILTVSCNDADYIPKQPDAGKVFNEKGISYQLMHNGIKVIKDCYYGSWMTDLIYGLKGHHEPQEEKLFYEVLKYIPEKGVMIELGSYWAYYSLWFAKEVLGSANYLVEPDPERLNIGKINFGLNGKNGIFFHGYVGGCGDDAGDCKNASRIFIDSFLEDNHIEHVNILHSDIQGAEYSMLESAIHSIESNKIDYFFISTHSKKIHTDCINFLKSHRYHIIAEHSLSESYSADGLIVARLESITGPDTIPISKRPS